VATVSNVATVCFLFFLFFRNPGFVGDSLSVLFFTDRAGLLPVGASVTVTAVAVVWFGLDVDVEAPLVVDERTLDPGTSPMVLSEKMSHALGIGLVAAAKLWQEPRPTDRACCGGIFGAGGCSRGGGCRGGGVVPKH
jgi:hypothetical protein